MTPLKYLSVLIFFFLINFKSYAQTTSHLALVGQYVSTDSKSEKTSTLTLNSDSTFLYFYMLGGCQDKVKGKWVLKDKTLILQMSLNADSVSYHLPDLNNIDWTITKKGLQPNNTIDNGCFKENALYRKVS